jgi:hypothetical protein
MLLNGYGYNWYRKENQLRADDLLVRQKAGHFLVEAAQKLQEQAAAYGRRHFPEPSREQPFPPAARMATHRLIGEQRQAILAMEGRIRGLGAPPEDKIWQRHRNEAGTLSELVRRDVQLVGMSRDLDASVGSLAVDDWDKDERWAPVREGLRAIGQAVTERSEFLMV